MKKTMTQKRVEWIKSHYEELILAREKMEVEKLWRCPNCKAKCGNGATCSVQGCSGMGYWARAFADINMFCNRKPYWSGRNPTPSTSINRGMSEYIMANAAELR